MKIKPIVESILAEASLSRVWQHIQNTKTFAVISAYRGSNTESQNLNRHAELKQSVRSLGLGFVEQKSGYTYADPDTGEEGNVEERSLFIPNISKDDAIKLGNQFNQESILWKDADEFILLYLNKSETASFATGTNHDLTFNPDILKYAYSQFLKSKNKNAIKKFAFVMKEFRAPTREESFAALKEGGGVAKGKWVTVIGSV